MRGQSSGILGWLVPSLLAAVVSVAALIQTYLITTATKELEHRRAVATLKLQIVEMANRLDFATGQLILEHVLKPVDEPRGFQRFAAEFHVLATQRAPEIQQGPSRDALLKIAPSAPTADLANLADRFNGPDRLTASNGLLQLYRSRGPEVVQALVQSLLPPQDQRSYRVNLYVAFTLARIEGGWRGTRSQLVAIEALRKTPSYSRDQIFRSRVEEAIANYLGA